MPSSIECIRADTLRPIAVPTSIRSEALPDVPALGDFVPGDDGIGRANTTAVMLEKLVESRDASDRGIGAITDAHITSFFDKMVKAGVAKAHLDYRAAYTLRFVKNVDADLPRNFLVSTCPR
jgi:hypothetical protein